MVGRNLDRLQTAAESIQSPIAPILFACDVTSPTDTQQLMNDLNQQLGRLDVLINNVGMSDRGLIESLDPNHLNDLLQANLFSSLHCVQAMLPLLKTSRGQIVNIGSLAAKVAPRYLGGYAIVKHALAALTQQLRLELRETGVNAMLVSPGPIRREDAGTRYRDRVQDGMPESANLPAGGARVKGLDPHTVARKIEQACRKRKSDIILPAYLRPIIAIGHLLPSVGDRILLWFTRSKSESPSSTQK